MLSIVYVRLTIKVKVGIPKSFKVRWYPHKITGSTHLHSSHLNEKQYQQSSVNSNNNIHCNFEGVIITPLVGLI